MVRLIDADALIGKTIIGGRRNNKTIIRYIVTNIVQNAPTVDAVPVRHGKWLDLEAFKRPWFRHHIFECSVCRNTLDMDGVNAGRGDANYCPNCGAKMDGERKEE